MAWLMVHQSLPTHRKTMMAADQLDIPPVQMVGHLVSFWLWALDNAPDGRLDGITDRSLARAAAWLGEPSLLVQTLRNVGFLDSEGEALAIHDWWDYAGKLMERRRANAERMRLARSPHVQRTDDARAPATVENSRVENTRGERLSALSAPTPAPDAPKPAKSASKSKQALVNAEPSTTGHESMEPRGEQPGQSPCAEPTANGRKPWPHAEQLDILLELFPLGCPFGEAPEESKGEYRQAAKGLGRLQATEAEMRATFDEMTRRNFPLVTPSALSKWFPRYGRKPNSPERPPPRRSVFDLSAEELDRGVIG